jgi:hypothetical protein
MRLLSLHLTLATLLGLLPSTSLGQEPGAAAGQVPATFRVFVLAGQSNMQGQGVVDLDHAEHYNGGRGILNRVAEEPELAPKLAPLRNGTGAWRTRQDVWCHYQREGQPAKSGPLGLGFTGYDGEHHFGPELLLGHLLGEAYDEPVLLVKTAWGGKSLQVDFRPPSAGGEVGPYYTRMLREIEEGIAHAQATWPAFREREPRVCGFVWFQGWNDMFTEGGEEAYARNLVALASDVRAALGAPDLPFVVGETGNAGSASFREQQRVGTERIPKPSAFVSTRAFLRPAEESPNTGHGHHWFGNAASYVLIGEALGLALLELLGA